MMQSQSPRQTPSLKGTVPVKLIKCTHDKCRKKFTSIDRYNLHIQNEHSDGNHDTSTKDYIGKIVTASTGEGDKNAHAIYKASEIDNSSENVFFGCSYSNCHLLFKNMIDRNSHEREVH